MSDAGSSERAVKNMLVFGVQQSSKDKTRQAVHR